MTIETLPDGLIVDILTCGVLDVDDLLKFGASCKRFHSLCSTNTVWKFFCLSHWPHLMRSDGKLMSVVKSMDLTLEKNEISLNKESTPRWMVLYQQINQAFILLKKMLRDNFEVVELDDEAFSEFCHLVDVYTYNFVSVYLLEIMQSECKSANLTDKYFARIAYHHIFLRWLTPQILQLLEGKRDSDNSVDVDFPSPLLQGVILIERWFNLSSPVESTDITSFIADAAEKTLQHFNSTCKLAEDCSAMEVAQYKLKSLNYVFFEELKFCGNQGDYFNVNNSFIHQVIHTRRGIPILLSIIYMEIASRIGVTLECVNNPGHFVLRWQVKELESMNPTVSDIAKAYRYIDVFNNGRTYEFEELPSISLRVSSATLQEVLHRVSLNVDAHTRISHQFDDNIRRSLDALNLCLLIAPDSHKVRSKRLLLHHANAMNLKTTLEDNRAIPEILRQQLSLPPVEVLERKLVKRIEERENERKAYKPTIKLRSSEENSYVCYSVGMVMKHKLYDYICVIRGWDNFCDMPQVWVLQMGVNRLARATQQPFYHVLVDKDGSQRYAAEDNLEIVEHAEELDHPEIGRYFSTTGRKPARHYIPNSELSLRYPEDKQQTLRVIDELYSGTWRFGDDDA